MIAPIWAHLKRKIKKMGPIYAKEESIERWHEAWQNLQQKMLRAQVQRICHHLIKVIGQKGGNEYLEWSGCLVINDNTPVQLPIAL
jgi:hypothetical protein